MKVAAKRETNALELADTKVKSADDDDDDADKTPAVDATLDETIRILTDYVTLFSTDSKKSLAGTASAK
jgi:hypothetical protein